MCVCMELSDYEQNRLTLLPQHLLCMQCLNGGGEQPFMYQHGLHEKFSLIKNNPEIQITLHAAFDNIGARTPLFWEQSPEDRKRDIDVLQRLSLVPGDTRTARELFRRTAANIPDLSGLCRYQTAYEGIWTECPLARSDYYEKGLWTAPLRTPDIMAFSKKASCAEIDSAEQIVVRPHHLLCVICFIGQDNNDKPLPEDNLFEIWKKLRDNPDIPVTLTEGAAECMVCPPCHNFSPNRGLCVASCSLRDRKKDLDTMLVLGVKPGDTIPARELIERIYINRNALATICAYPPSSTPEWASCDGVSQETLKKGLDKGVLY